MQAEGQVRRTQKNIVRGHVSAFLSLAALAVLLLSGCAGYTPSSTTATPQLIIVPNVIEFKNVVVGQKSTQTIQLSVSGSAPLDVTQIQVSGKGFILTPTTLPLKLSPGSSKTVNLAFDPIVPGDASGTLSVMTDNPKIFGSAPLSGTGEKAVAQLIVIVPNVIEFKNVVVGQKNTQSIQLSVSGSASLDVTQIQVSGKGFILTPTTLPLKLSPGSSKTVNLAFDPIAPGDASGTLSVMTDNPKIFGSAPLSGTGEKAVAQLQVSPASLNFGNLKLQTTSSKNVTLKNTGDVNVTINGVTLSGAGFGYSDLTPGFSLAPQQQLTFQVWFKPMAKGAATGKLALISASLASPISMPLAGDGTTTAPPPPSQHSVKLDWNPSASAVTGYHVYRGDISGGPYGRISSSAVGGLSFTDSTVSSGATYFYVVTAVNSAGEESVFSNETPAAVPNP